MKTNKINQPAEWKAVQLPANDALTAQIAETVPALTDGQRKRILAHCAKQLHKAADTDWDSQSEEVLAPVEHSRKASPVWMKAACCLAVLLLGGGAFAIWRSSKNDPQAWTSGESDASSDNTLSVTGTTAPENSDPSSGQTTAVTVDNVQMTTDGQVPVVHLPAQNAAVGDAIFPTVAAMGSRTEDNITHIYCQLLHTKNPNGEPTTVYLSGQLLREDGTEVLPYYQFEYVNSEGQTALPGVGKTGIFYADAVESTPNPFFWSLGTEYARTAMTLEAGASTLLRWDIDTSAFPITNLQIEPGNYQLKLDLCATQAGQSALASRTVTVPFTIPDAEDPCYYVVDILRCDGATLTIGIMNYGTIDGPIPVVMDAQYAIYAQDGTRYGKETWQDIAQEIPAGQMTTITKVLTRDLGVTLPAGLYTFIGRIDGQLVEFPFTVEATCDETSVGIELSTSGFHGWNLVYSVRNASTHDITYQGVTSLERLNPNTMMFEKQPMAENSFAPKHLSSGESTGDLSHTLSLNQSSLEEGFYRLILSYDEQVFAYYFSWKNNEFQYNAVIPHG